MKSFKPLIIIGVVALAFVALAFRVPKLRQLVTGEPAVAA